MTTEHPSFDADRALLLDSQLCFALYSTSLVMIRLYVPLLDDLARIFHER
jgi:MarR family transcriptional regulator, organic hydroperoxide resistance regulator